MKKWKVFGVSLIAFLFFVSLVCAVRINEIMANPSDDCNDCTEWIEIYTDSPINVTNWIIDTNGQETNFSFYIEDFLIITGNKTSFLINWNVNESKIIEWKGIGLVNSGDNVSLFNESIDLVDFIDYPSFSSHENKTYSLLSNSSWIICENATPGSANSCSSQNQDPPQDNEAKIYLEASWDEEEIKNGEEFEIEVKAYNLKDESYNLKIWIEFNENDTIISDSYDEENDEWKSGAYYVDNFFSGEGNKTKKISLRIRNSYENFKVYAVLKAKLESENYLLGERITILEKEDENNNDNYEDKNEDKKENNETQKTATQPTGSVIRLGNRSKLQEQNNTKEEILYESSSEKIKKYAVYALNIVLIIIIVLLIKKKV